MLTLLFRVSTAKQVDRLLKTGRVIDVEVLLLVALMLTDALQQLVQQHQVATSKVMPMDQPKSGLSAIFLQCDTVRVLSVRNLFHSCPFMMVTWVQPGCCQISCARHAVLLPQSHCWQHRTVFCKRFSFRKTEQHPLQSFRHRPSRNSKHFLGK